MKSHENAIHLTGYGQVKWEEENILKKKIVDDTTWKLPYLKEYPAFSCQS